MTLRTEGGIEKENNDYELGNNDEEKSFLMLMLKC